MAVELLSECGMIFRASREDSPDQRTSTLCSARPSEFASGEFRPSPLVFVSDASRREALRGSVPGEFLSDMRSDVTARGGSESEVLPIGFLPRLRVGSGQHVPRSISGANELNLFEVRDV
jgi:hypothetical protein